VTVADAAEVIAEAARSARDLGDSYEGDPARLDEVEQRLSAILDLRRRFQGFDIESILVRTDEAERELAEIEGGDERLATLEAGASHARADYEALAATLSAKRKVAAKRLETATEGHLNDLGLTGAKLVVGLEIESAGVRGNERVRMLLAANRGLEPVPLDKGASGGELSRVNLALLLAASAERGTWIFDEVDAGIGGATAHVVAAKLKALSEHVQVIVVTHLAQIAVVADHHLVVRKDESGDYAATTVFELESKTERETELARLIGADANDEHAAATAAKLLRDASAS
jgi:DNA repair protein RecN (Recombination protein N)